MSTYVIGDLQGCLDPLIALLKTVQFDPKRDKVWFTGDLINRGPKSLETLRFVKQLGKQAISVLGNHDITLLAVAYGSIPFHPKHHTFTDILEAPDRDELIEWLRYRPLVHWDKTYQTLMSHAGIYPLWNRTEVTTLADELAQAFQQPDPKAFLTSLYGNTPSRWHPSLTGTERTRFICNSLTRMRFCNEQGDLELTCKNPPTDPPSGYQPWYSLKNRKPISEQIVFGHWAALNGQCPIQNIEALDTGCVFGRTLTALRLEDNQRFSQSA